MSIVSGWQFSRSGRPELGWCVTVSGSIYASGCVDPGYSHSVDVVPQAEDEFRVMSSNYPRVPPMCSLYLCLCVLCVLPKPMFSALPCVLQPMCSAVAGDSLVGMCSMFSALPCVLQPMCSAVAGDSLVGMCSMYVFCPAMCSPAYVFCCGRG